MEGFDWRSLYATWCTPPPHGLGRSPAELLAHTPGQVMLAWTEAVARSAGGGARPGTLQELGQLAGRQRDEVVIEGDVFVPGGL